MKFSCRRAALSLLGALTLGGAVITTACTPAASNDGDPSMGAAGHTGAAGATAGMAGKSGGAGSPASGTAGKGVAGTPGTAGAIAGMSGGAAGAAPPLDAMPPTKEPDAGAEPGDAGPPPPVPTLAGTVILLDASKGVMANGDKVTRWTDQSGKKNDAINGNANFQPQLAMVNGVPVIRFSGKRNPSDKTNGGGTGGTFLRVLDNAGVQFGNGDWLVEVVTAYTNELDGSHNGGFGTFFGKFGDSGEILFTGNWTYSEKVEQACVHLGFGEAAPVGIETVRGSYEKDKAHPLNDGKVRVIGARRVGNKVSVRINGVVDTTETLPGASNMSVEGKNIGIGSFSANSDTSSDRALKGDIYYMIVVKGATSDADVKTLETALMARFNAAP